MNNNEEQHNSELDMREIKCDEYRKNCYLDPPRYVNQSGSGVHSFNPEYLVPLNQQADVKKIGRKRKSASSVSKLSKSRTTIVGLGKRKSKQVGGKRRRRVKRKINQFGIGKKRQAGKGKKRQIGKGKRKQTGKGKLKGGKRKKKSENKIGQRFLRLAACSK